MKDRTGIEASETDEQYRDLIENSTEGVAVLQDGKVVFYNKFLKDYVGYTDEELKSKTFSDFIHPDDVNVVVDSYARSMKGEEVPGIYEFRVISKDGTITETELYTSMSLWNGKPAVLCYFRNITDRKRTELELKKSEEKFRLLYENLPGGSFIINSDYLIEDANDFLCQITGFKREELIGHECDIICPKGPHKCPIFDMGKERIENDETAVKSKDGRFIPIIKSARRIPIRGVEVVVENFQDITEMKIARKNLEKSEETIRNIFETSEEVLFASDIKGEITDINPAIERVAGYSVDEIIGKSAFIFYEDPYEREELISELKRTGFLKNKEIHLYAKDGSILYGLVTANPRLDDKGNIIGLRGSIRDITEMKKLEYQFMQTQKMEAIGNLAGGIAHNFNNILMGIMGYAEFLVLKKKPDDQDYKAVKTIFDATQRAVELTTQLLNIARSGTHIPRKINLNNIVKETLLLLSGSMDKSVKIETHYEEEVKPIKGDRGQLEQCLLNLCINAREAMKVGGKIVIETQNVYLEDNYATNHIEAGTGDYVMMSVSDTGVGIPAKIKERIFEPFFTTKSDKGGTGMGLATLYGIIKNHGGFVNVYSEEGKGSVFKLYFPVSLGVIDEEEELGEELAEGTAAGGTETVLIIDDEQYVLDIWADYLTDNGFKVLTAKNGKKGIKLFKERADDIDIVILDYIMPDISGRDVLKRLKEIKKDIKVLVASGYSKNGQAKEMMEGDADGFIQKPSSLSELIRKIRGIIDR
ncbi:MAG: PAS domain S-box protein [Deltaproteobacteria bacterium]|uniref:histidine kinase n=1 Tax=Candidatus Zymogenus saltonus TaxID=2844893 RepID=A0A9D8PP61_9DELT|nr:PAS domain S-box protein [Candidatus Zymogenus saltonus]